MGKCKTKAIPVDLDIFMHFAAYSDIFRHIQAYSAIIQPCSEPCATLTYSEPWHNQNQKQFQNTGISKTLAHSEPQTFSESWDIQNWGHTHNLVKHL